MSCYLLRRCPLQHCQLVLKSIKNVRSHDQVSFIHNYLRSRLDAILSRTSSRQPEVLVSLSEDQLNQLQDTKLKDDSYVLFSNNKKNNVMDMTTTGSGKAMVDTQSKEKELRWWDPIPEVNFNWYKLRWERMSKKEKEQQFWPGFIASMCFCAMILVVIKLVESYGMYGRDRFWELSTGDKLDENEKINYRKHQKPEKVEWNKWI